MKLVSYLKILCTFDPLLPLATLVQDNVVMASRLTEVEDGIVKNNTSAVVQP